MYSSCHLPIWPTDPWRSLIGQENSCYVRVPLAVARIIILKNLLGLNLVKIPGLSAWLIFDLSLFEQQLLLSLIPSIPVVSSGTMLTPGAMSWWVLITMGTLSICRDENKVYPKKKIPRDVLKQNLNFPVGFKGDMRVTWKICKFKVLLKSHAFQVLKEEALSSNKEIDERSAWQRHLDVYPVGRGMSSSIWCALGYPPTFLWLATWPLRRVHYKNREILSRP